MATEIATDLDESYEGDSSDDMEPPTERWAPLGAAASLPSLAAIDSRLTTAVINKFFSN